MYKTEHWSKKFNLDKIAIPIYEIYEKRVMSKGQVILVQCVTTRARDFLLDDIAVLVFFSYFWSYVENTQGGFPWLVNMGLPFT